MTGQFTFDPERAGTSTTVERSALDRRREKLQANKTAARAAIDAIADLDARLDHNSSQTREYEAALQAAVDQVAALKKAIKAAGKQQVQLDSARKDAQRAAAQAQQRAAAAEAKYDRAVLAEIVRREKDHDLSLHSPTASAGTAASDAPFGATSTIAGEGDRPTLDTARTTAARITADRAQAGTHLTSDAGPGSRASSNTPPTGNL
jgi:chromosome segregation ATPase